MKIALLTTSYFPQVGGAELVVHHLAKEWSFRGHQVEVFCEQGYDAAPLDLGYPVTTYPVLRGSYRVGPHRFPFLQFNAMRLGARINACRPDFISAHFGYPVGVLLSRHAELASKALVTCHGKDLTSAEWGYRNRYQCSHIMAMSLNRFPGVVAVSRFARRQLEAIGVAAEKIHHVSNGVDVERFSRKPSPVIRQRYKIPESAILILSVGRHSLDKAYQNAIDAVSRLNLAKSEVCYLIVGAGVEQILLKNASRTGPLRIILCSGLYGDELVAAYHEADIYFSSSVSELCPLTVLEAMAAGLPLVLTDISGHQDLIEPERNGVLIAPADAMIAAAALNRLIEDRTLRQAMSRSNRQKAAAYSWTSIGKQYLELAERTINGEGHFDGKER